MNANVWSRLTAPLVRRIKLLVTRAVVKLVDPAQMMQSLQIEALAGEVLDNVEHFEPYGYTSHPLNGAEVLLFSVGGRRAHAIAGIVADRRYRLKNLAAGEVAIYTDEGDSIVLKRGRNIEVTAGTAVKVTAPQVEVIATTKVILTTPVAEITGNLNVGGNVAAQGDVTAGTISLKTHPHGGVSPGGSLTGMPQ